MFDKGLKLEAAARLHEKKLKRRFAEASSSQTTPARVPKLAKIPQTKNKAKEEALGDDIKEREREHFEAHLTSIREENIRWGWVREHGLVGTYLDYKKGPKTKRLFVSNLKWETTETSLSRFFEQFGPVPEAHIVWRVNGNSRGVGFVTMGSYDAVAEILQKKNMSLDGRTLECKLSVPQKYIANKLYVGGLAKEDTKEDLVEFFSKFGHVLDSCVILGRCFGFIEFSDPEVTTRILANKTFEMDGKILEIKRSTERKAIVESSKWMPKNNIGRNSFRMNSHDYRRLLNEAHKSGIPPWLYSNDMSRFGKTAAVGYGPLRNRGIPPFNLPVPTGWPWNCPPWTLGGAGLSAASRVSAMAYGPWASGLMNGSSGSLPLFQGTWPGTSMGLFPPWILGDIYPVH